MLLKAVKSFVGVLITYTRKLMRLVVLSRYNRYTISEYFRKQGAQIGEGCSIIPRYLGNEPYLIKIGNNVTVASGVIFVTHDGAARTVLGKEIPEIRVYGPIVIEDNCVIGQNVILMPDIHIGKNSIVGAGSVVISNIPPNSIAMGVPARVLTSIEAYKKKTIARWNEQKLPPQYYAYEESRGWRQLKKHKEYREKIKEHLIRLFWNKKEKG
jgi:acetyltransferase-like isoleucine patch superfamily enzyme